MVPVLKNLLERAYLSNWLACLNSKNPPSPRLLCVPFSLYPSLYRAYNLCYTTLVHPGESWGGGMQPLGGVACFLGRCAACNSWSNMVKHALVKHALVNPGWGGYQRGCRYGMLAWILGCCRRVPVNLHAIKPPVWKLCLTYQGIYIYITPLIYT